MFGDGPDGKKDGKKEHGHKHHSISEADPLDDPKDGHKHHSLSEADALEDPKDGHKHHSLSEAESLEDPGDLSTTEDNGGHRQVTGTTHGYGSHKHNALSEDKMSDK